MPVRGSSRLAMFALDRFLHLLEGADLDLPDAFRGTAELAGEILRVIGVLGEAPGLEDAALARIEHTEGSLSAERRF